MFILTQTHDATLQLKDMSKGLERGVNISLKIISAKSPSNRSDELALPLQLLCPRYQMRWIRL